MNVTFGIWVNIIHNLSEWSEVEEVRENRNYPLYSSLLNIVRFNHNYIFLVPVLMMYWSSASLLFLTMEQIFISLNSIHALSVPSLCSASISLAQSNPSVYQAGMDVSDTISSGKWADIAKVYSRVIRMEGSIQFGPNKWIKMVCYNRCAVECL